MWEVINGDCIAVMGTLSTASVDSVVTDPPYGLEFMGAEWDTYRATGAVPQSGKRPVSDQRGAHDEGYRNMRGKEHLYQQWCEAWAREAYRVLKPGGHLLAFGGTRTYHREACAIEDAGFEIRDSLHWIYGSGFPKSLDVGKAIDKAAGADREAVGPNPNHRPVSGTEYEGIYSGGNTGAATVTAPATPEGQQWDGWGTALKPAHEPVIVARKPLIGTVAANVLAHGTGGINVDGCRVEAGRWPPNVLLTHSPDCNGDCADDCPVAEMDRQSSSSFFPCFKYQAKAPKTERPVVEGVPAHPTVKPVTLMRWLVRLVTPPGGTVLDPFAGTGTTAEACQLEGFNSISIEADPGYVEHIKKRMRGKDTLL